MPPILMSASIAAPKVFVADNIRMFCSHIDTSRINWMGFESLHAFSRPLLETRAMRIVTNVGYHEIRQVAVLVCDGVDESVLRIDDFFGQFDRCVMTGRRKSRVCWG